MSNKWKTFQYVFKNSLWNIGYYNDVLKASLRFSLTYFFILLYLVIFFQTLVSSLSLAFLLPRLPEFTNTTKQRLETIYPKDLVLTFRDGHIMTNKKQPFSLDVPEVASLQKDHFVTFDSKAKADDYISSRSLILVTNDSIVYPDAPLEGKEQYAIAKIAPHVNEKFSYKDFVLIRSKINFVLDRLHIFAPIFLIAMTIFIPIIMSILQFSWNMLYLALLSCIVWLIAYLFKVKWNYKNSFQALLHGSTLAIVLSTLLGLLGVFIPLLYSATLMLWMVIVLSRIQTAKKL